MYKFAARKETMGDHLIISTVVLSEEKDKQGGMWKSCGVRR